MCGNMSLAYANKSYDLYTRKASWKDKISALFGRYDSHAQDEKLSSFLTSLLSRPYRANHIHLSFSSRGAC